MARRFRADWQLLHVWLHNYGQQVEEFYDRVYLVVHEMVGLPQPDQAHDSVRSSSGQSSL